MLHRALRDVRQGCYLDVGAAEPEADSVTKAFYDRGWRGINVEPLAGPFARLVEARREDVNLNLAVGAMPGEASLYVVGNENGLSTLDTALAARHRGSGWPVEERRVPVTTLAEICATQAVGTLHFLKIDAEGAELDILRGADFTRWRPWIILLEAPDPRERLPGSEEWESQVLTPAGYEFVYQDGLNRFYLASERDAELRGAFQSPPNVFDNFVLASVPAAQAQAAAAARQRDEALAAQQQAAAEARSAEAKALELEVRLQETMAQAQLVEAQHQDTIARAQAAEAALPPLTGQLARMEADIGRLAFERNGWAQELFETNRHAAELVVARQMLTEEVARLRDLEELPPRLYQQIVTLQKEATVLHTRIDTLNAQAATRGEETVALRADRDRVRREAEEWLDSLRRSTSWRLTRPLRVIMRLFRRG